MCKGFALTSSFPVLAVFFLCFASKITLKGVTMSRKKREVLMYCSNRALGSVHTEVVGFSECR